MSEHRMEPRNQGYAKTIMDSRPGYLRNLTEEGCKIVTVSALPYSIGEVLTFQILPDETSGLDRMTVTAELRWEKKDGPYFVYGFLISNFASENDRKIYFKLVTQYNRA
ncbi:MAG: hypothetical protein DRP70_11650 [Spirochaetes bacterium]|nr:MAG: hypothetical protein DRP60_11720 [Spirochaetota bacterium]RKX85475.1 MAG: hypothetical protein DRP70_11650 [Spirochaetota bacterium]